MHLTDIRIDHIVRVDGLRCTPEGGPPSPTAAATRSTPISRTADHASEETRSHRLQREHLHSAVMSVSIPSRDDGPIRPAHSRTLCTVERLDDFLSHWLNRPRRPGVTANKVRLSCTSRIHPPMIPTLMDSQEYARVQILTSTMSHHLRSEYDQCWVSGTV